MPQNIIYEKFIKLQKAEMSGVYNPLPVEECAKLFMLVNSKNKEDLIKDLAPDLNTYMAEIVGYCSWKDKILEWSDDKIKQVNQRLENNFFQQFPQYKIIEQLITPSQTPLLYQELQTYEHLRKCLIDLLSFLSQINFAERTSLRPLLKKQLKNLIL